MMTHTKVKTRTAIYVTLLWLALVSFLTTDFLCVTAQSGRLNQSTLPTSTPSPSARPGDGSDEKPGFVPDRNGDQYRLVFPVVRYGSLHQRGSEFDQAVHSRELSFIEQLSKVG